MEVFEITVPVEDVTDKLTLRQLVGESSFDGEVVPFDSALPMFSAMVRFRGRQYLINIHAMQKADEAFRRDEALRQKEE